MAAPAGCARAAPQLLAHVNLLLAAFGGAALATGARLKWDPSTYLVLRELAPGEYRALAALLPAAGLALLLLAQLALAALARSSRHPARRLLLLIYALCTALMVVAEVALGVWAYRRVAAWWQSQDVADVEAALAVREHAIAVLVTLARWHPIPSAIKDVIEEAEEDAPRNGYVAGAAGAALLLLQVLAMVLALLSRRRAPATRAADARRILSLRSSSDTVREIAPLANGGQSVMA